MTRDRRLGLTMLGITALSWGLNFPAMKLLLAEWSPLSLRAFAGLLGALLAACIAWSRGQRLMPPSGQWPMLIVASLLNFTSWMGLATLSLLWLYASEAAIISASLPIWVAVLAWPILGERPTRLRMAGLLLGLSGVAVLLAGQSVQAGWAKAPGVACVLGAAIFFSLGAVLTKRRPLRLPPITSVAWQVGLGTLPLVVLALLIETPHLERLSVERWAGMTWLAIMPLCVAYLAWFRALQLLPASTAAIGTLLVPAIGVVASGLVLGEPLGTRQVLALGLTCSGVLIAARG